MVNLSIYLPSCERISGYSKNEFLNNPDLLLEIVHPEDYDRLLKHKNEIEVHDKKVELFSFRITGRDGNIRWIEHVCRSVYSKEGAYIGRRISNRDITGRKKAEKEIKKVNIYNRGLIESSIDPLVTIGPDGKITDVNSATELITGYSRKKLIGTDFSEYFTWPEKAREGYQKVFEDGVVRNYELEIKNKNGRVIPVSYNASVYKDEPGMLLGFLQQHVILQNLKLQKNPLKKLMIL